MNVYLSFEILETTMKSYFCCNIELIAYFLFQARTFASLVLRPVNCINSRTCPNSRLSGETNTCSDELLTLSFHKKIFFDRNYTTYCKLPTIRPLKGVVPVQHLL